MATNIVMALGALMAGVSGLALLARKAFVTDNLDLYGVPRSWWPGLGLLKVTGAVGLLVGLWVRPIGVAAATGLFLYFAGAIVTVLRAHKPSHAVFPLAYLTPPAIALVLIGLGAGG
ncbi:DoxX-like protein [Kribbella sp. VKM Ac-2571]|uniref:DoxX family protein n=1 Tax=Kribbella sp. VKM Ac-2571 TaxID=2512222 RepID=UPI00105E3457|nr:DoxX family protein [Kribbella sp. VKM Ac-2571]TDO56652.1 DoxX-like protein [Kribbella sp. VKM Ac-2571]